jgi:hypothetical protein
MGEVRQIAKVLNRFVAEPVPNPGVANAGTVAAR